MPQAYYSLKSIGRQAGNYLLQSTAFAAVAVLLALTLRANHERIRYWLWLTASLAIAGPVAVGIMNVPRIQAQALPEFEVASVKPASPSQRNVDFRIFPEGRLVFENVELGLIIQEAFSIKRAQILGAPGWLYDEHFNIEAKAAGPSTREQMMAMLQSLLAERFHLQARRESHEGDIYELELANGGSPLKESTATETYLRLLRNTPRELPGISYTIKAQKVTMARFADHLTPYMKRPVVDRTRLSGEYDFQVDYAVDGHPEEGPPLSIAIQRDLGLRLRAAKGPVEALVIDHVEKVPTEN